MKIFPITRERLTRERLLAFSRTMARQAELELRSRLQQFTPFSSERKNTDSCVIGSAPAKAGHFLMMSIFEYLGKWENIEVGIGIDFWYKGPPHGDNIDHPFLPQFAVKKLRNGQVVVGMLPWSKGLEKSMAQVTPNRRIKHVFTYRDPRDIFVSWLNFITYSKKFIVGQGARKKQRFMLENFSDDDERLTFIINTGLRVNSSNQSLLGFVYEPWLRSPHCLAIKFEDLYPEVINLRKGVLGKVLRSLLDYLEVDIDTIDPLDFYSKVYGKSLTASSLVSKVGQYKRVFKDHHYALIDNPEFRSMLNAFGYEW